jgi:hypothetical protein
MADRLTVMTTDVVDEAHQRFIGAREAFFLATVLRRLLGVIIRSCVGPALRRCAGGRPALGAAIPGSGDGFGLAAFAPDGSVLVTPGRTGTLLLDLETADWQNAACTLAGRQLTRSEWDRYLPSAGGYEPSCSSPTIHRRRRR